MNKKNEIMLDTIHNRIFTYRGLQVMIDRDLAELYDVEVKRLNEQVKRNIERFPVEFRFQLSDDEKKELVANCDWLTQSQVVTLFNSSKANVSEQIKHIFASNKLQEEATVRKIRTVQKEGNRMVRRDLLHYNLQIRK